MPTVPHIKIVPDSARLAEALRIIARHATACADELVATAGEDEGDA